jgi:hypothetical protein
MTKHERLFSIGVERLFLGDSDGRLCMKSVHHLPDVVCVVPYIWSIVVVKNRIGRPMVLHLSLPILFVVLKRTVS